MCATKPLVALAAAIGLLGSMKAAVAQTTQTCATDSDCQHGYVCQATGAVGTSVCPANAPCNLSGQGGSPAAPDDSGGGVDPTSGSGTTGSGTSGAASTTVSTCQPGPCSTDNDCAAGMVCHSEMVTSCSGGEAKPACPPDTKCDSSSVGSPPTCTTNTVSTCTFKWALPCNADADCGDGFACHPAIGGVCSGGAPSAGIGGDTGGTATGNSGGTQPPDGTCTTTMSFPGSCRPIAQSCSADSDCPSNWLCQEVITRNVVGVGGAGGAGGSVGAPSATGGGSSAGAGISSPATADVAPLPNVKMCVSPYSSPVGVKDDGSGGRDGSGPTGGTPTGTVSPGNDGTTTGSNEGGGTGGTTGAGALAGAGGKPAPHSPALSGDSSGGCNVAPSGGSGLLAGIGAGLALLISRRRRS